MGKIPTTVVRRLIFLAPREIVGVMLPLSVWGSWCGGHDYGVASDCVILGVREAVGDAVWDLEASRHYAGDNDWSREIT